MSPSFILFRLFRGFVGMFQHIAHELSAKPFILGGEVPCEDGEDRNGAKNHGSLCENVIRKDNCI
jgi:hypothetical protein